MASVESRPGGLTPEQREEQSGRISFLRAHPEFDDFLAKRIDFLESQNMRIKAQVEGDSAKLQEIIATNEKNAAVITQIPEELLIILGRIFSFHRQDFSTRLLNRDYIDREYFARRRTILDLEAVRKHYAEFGGQAKSTRSKAGTHLYTRRTG